MHICLLSRAIPIHHYGGLETHTFTLAHALQHRGHKITIITSAQFTPSAINNPPSAINIVYIPKTKPGRYSLSFFRESAKLINELDKQESFDIIHAQGFAGFGYMFKKTKPLVVTIHGTLTSETLLFTKKFSLSHLWKHRNRLGVTPLYHQLLTRADAIVVDSYFSKQLLLKDQKHIKPKLSVVYLGIDTAYFQPHNKSDAKQKFGFSSDLTLLAFGRIIESKGFQILLEAVINLKDIPYQLIIAGEGPYLIKLKERAKTRKLTQQVRFLGKVSEAELPYLYSAADIFIIPELTAPAFGLVAAEALACGTPVIASNTGALPEVVTPEVGICIPAGDTDKLANAIRELYQNKEKWNQMRYSARTRAETMFTVDRMAEETERIYKSICKI
ncbi:MAG: glycosyltransferase family 4 protein [bacterium]|nr:glycosyltransferase family 4 protein [bacterium]